MTNVKVVPFTSSYLKNMNSEKYTLEMNVKMLAGSVEEAANRLDASAQRMGNAWDRLKRTVGDSGVSQAIANDTQTVSTEETVMGGFLK